MPFMTVPVPAPCVQAVAAKYGVPSAVLYAMLKTEAGVPGKSHKNKDGSRDWGPMQINDRWFVFSGSEIRRKFPEIAPADIKTDPCVNLDVAGWILWSNLQRDHNLWKAIGHYHSFRKREAIRYRHMVWRWYWRIRRYWRKQTMLVSR